MLFTKPKNLDGAKLRAELRAAGVTISDDPKAVSLVDNELNLDIDELKSEIVVSIINAHDGV